MCLRFEYDQIKFSLKNDYLLQAQTDGAPFEIYLKRCFPWTHPYEFISVRNVDDKEIFFIEDLNELDESDQKLFRDQLKNALFTLDITRINSIDDEVEIRKFDVQTNKGHRVFQTMIDYWPEILSNGEVIINDLSGDLYKIADLRSLDTKSRELIENYLD